MITKPDNFAEYCYRSGEQLHWVVEIQNKDSDVWYFSDIGMDVDEGQVLQLLLEPPRISEQMDVFTKRWGFPQCSVVISNLPVLVNSDGTKSRFSDVMGDTANRTMKIYAVAGPTCGSLADDALLRFSGIVLDTPGYDADTMQVRGVSGLSRYNQPLPQRVMGDDYANCPTAVADKHIPILYGQWDHEYGTDAPYSGLGLAVGLLTETPPLNDDTYEPRFAVAGHECGEASDTGAAVDVGGPVPLIMGTTDVEGNGTYGATVGWLPESDGQFKNEFLLALAFPVKSTGATDVVNAANLIDDNTATYASIRDCTADTGIMLRGRGYLSLMDPAHLTELVLKGGYSNSRLEVWVPHYNVVPQIIGDISNEHQAILRLGYSLLYGVTIEFWEATANLVTNVAGWAWTQFPADDFDPPDRAQTRAANLQLHAFAHNSTTIGDYITDNQEMVRIHELPEILVKAKVSTLPNQVWVAGEGRLYGSWIDGRSSGYTVGDLIEEPGGIIESILRDELGMTDDQIDMPSFIDCEFSNIKHHVNITEERGAFEIIRKICEQSHFALCFTAEGKVRITDLRYNASRSADATIPASHIINIDVSRTKVHSTRAEVRARYLPERGEYYDRVSWWATAPAVRYGLVAYKLDLDYCLDQGPIGFSGSAFNLCSHLFGTRGTYNTPGLLSNKKTQITVTTAGMTHIDIELGDAISIDPDMDNILLCNGATWDSRTFIVTDIRVDGDACTITAVDIDEGM